MLSRRQLRIKVLQSLYAFFQGQKTDLAVSERELFRSIDKVNELYIYLLLFLQELAEADKLDEEELWQKFYPNKDELVAKNRLYKLSFIEQLGAHDGFRQEVARYRLSWQKHQDLIRKVFLEVKHSEEYRSLIKGESVNEKEFLVDLIKNQFLQLETLSHQIEEENIFWLDDLDFICHIIIRMIKSFYESGKFALAPLYKDEEDDKEFLCSFY